MLHIIKSKYPKPTIIAIINSVKTDRISPVNKSPPAKSPKELISLLKLLLHNIIIEIVRTPESTAERPAECDIMKTNIPMKGSQMAIIVQTLLTLLSIGYSAMNVTPTKTKIRMSKRLKLYIDSPVIPKFNLTILTSQLFAIEPIKASD